MSGYCFVWNGSRLARHRFVTQRTHWNLHIFQSRRRALMTFISPMLATKVFLASIAFDGQKIQLATTLFAALVSDVWKLHSVLMFVRH